MKYHPFGAELKSVEANGKGEELVGAADAPQEVQSKRKMNLQSKQVDGE